MKTVILFAAILFAGLVETSLYSVPLTLYLAVFLCVFDVRGARTWSFLSGIVLDILAYRYLGSSSLIFLLGFFCWQRISEKFQASSFVYQALFMIGMIFSYHLFILHILYSPQIIRDIVLGIVLLLCMGRMIPPIKRSQKLSLS